MEWTARPVLSTNFNSPGVFGVDARDLAFPEKLDHVSLLFEHVLGYPDHLRLYSE
jgi:hypothetical protein